MLPSTDLMGIRQTDPFKVVLAPFSIETEQGGKELNPISLSSPALRVAIQTLCLDYYSRCAPQVIDAIGWKYQERHAIDPVKDFTSARTKSAPLLTQLRTAQKQAPDWEKPYLATAELNLRRIMDCDRLRVDEKLRAAYDKEFSDLIVAQKDHPLARRIWAHRLDMWLMVGDKQKADALAEEFLKTVPEYLRPFWAKMYWINKNYLIYPGFSTKEEIERGPSTMDEERKAKRDALHPAPGVAPAAPVSPKP